LAVLSGAIVFVGYAVVAFLVVWLLTDVVLADIGPALVVPEHDLGAARMPTHVEPGSARPVAVAVRLEQALSQWGRIGIVATAPIAGLATGLVAWLVSGRALRPVGVMEQCFRELASGDMSLRVPQPNGRDEVARLASTMNSTLDQLEAATRKQRRFVADAAHELRGPIGAVRADLEVAAAYPGRVDLAKSLREALIDLDRLQVLATDLLTLARLESGEPTPEVVLSIADVLDEVRTPAGVDFAVRGDLTTTISGSRAQLARLLQNVIDNAARHATSRVTVAIDRSEDRVTIDVDDDGQGIPIDEREGVFARFHRIDDARTRESGGVGLGLAIVAETARTHGGSAQAQESPLGGARIRVVLPAVQSPDDSTRSPPR
jgi:signal transduction histidine kinase